MGHAREAEILAASQSLRVPGSGEQRVLVQTGVERLADTWGAARWEVEAAALEVGVTPLHYLRNLARFGVEGQIRLLKAAVSLVGHSEAVERAAELLAGMGVGRLLIHATVSSPGEEEAARAWQERAVAIAGRQNTSCEARGLTLSLRGGNPTEAVRGADVVAACLLDSAEEQLLQFACRMGKVPLVLVGVEEQRGQVTTVFPGDAGVALVYKPTHPHLEPQRGSRVERRASLMAGSWIADQASRVVLGQEEVLRHRLLYADLGIGEMAEYQL